MEAISAIEHLLRKYIASANADTLENRPRRPLSLTIIAKDLGTVTELLSHSTLDVSTLLHTVDLSTVLTPPAFFKELAMVADSSRPQKIPVFVIGDFAVNNFEWLKYFLAIMEDGRVSSSTTTQLPPSVLVFTTKVTGLLGVGHQRSEVSRTYDDNLLRMKFYDFVSRLSMYFEFNKE
jgi:hypothetical protein